MAPDRDFSSSLVLQVKESIFEFGSRDEYLSRVEGAGLLPAARLSQHVRQGLEAIRREDQYERAPSTTNAAATLIDGTYLPRVDFIPERLVRQWLLPFWKRYVKPETVAEIRRSPNRIPLPYRQGIWVVGETSMGSLSFVITLKDGSTFGCLYPGASDLVELPPPYTPADIVDLEIGVGLAKAQKVVLREPDFVWCPFYESPEEELDRAVRVRSVDDLWGIGLDPYFAVELRLVAEECLVSISADQSNPEWLRSLAGKAANSIHGILPKRAP